jgi:hypothetical protein
MRERRRLSKAAPRSSTNDLVNTFVWPAMFQIRFPLSNLLLYFSDYAVWITI